MNTEDYRERIEEILEWFIGYPRQDDVAGNYDEAVPKLLSLIQEAYKKGYIDGGIEEMTKDNLISKTKYAEELKKGDSSE